MPVLSWLCNEGPAQRAVGMLRRRNTQLSRIVATVVNTGVWAIMPCRICVGKTSDLRRAGLGSLGLINAARGMYMNTALRIEFPCPAPNERVAAH